MSESIEEARHELDCTLDPIRCEWKLEPESVISLVIEIMAAADRYALAVLENLAQLLEDGVIDSDARAQIRYLFGAIKETIDGVGRREPA